MVVTYHAALEKSQLMWQDLQQSGWHEAHPCSLCSFQRKLTVEAALNLSLGLG